MLIKDIFEAFQVGKSLANSALWKNRSLAANTLTTFAALGVSISAAFGYKLEVDHDTLQAIAGGIAALICLLNSGVTIVTSDKVGVLKGKTPTPDIPPMETPTPTEKPFTYLDSLSNN
jgi:hypothetical protein